MATLLPSSQKPLFARRCVLRVLRRAALVACMTVGLVLGVPGIAVPAAAGATPPVIALYYAWFDQNSWNPAGLSDVPTGPYRSAERSTIERHVGQARSAGIDVFALNWWGPGNPTDDNLKTLLSVAGNSGFGVTIDFDLNSPVIANPGDAANALKYATQYYGSPAWFRYQGKPVVMFYGNRRYDVGTWSSIRSQVDPGHQAIWIGEGDLFGCLSVFDGIHPYSISWSPDPAGQLASYAGRTRAMGADKLWVATVMPGYDDTRLGRGGAAYARDRQGGALYRGMWEGAIATKPAMISITSFNEWPEGSQIEPSARYGDLYLQITKQYSDRYKSGPPPAPSAQPAPSSAAVGVGRWYSEAGQGRGGYTIQDDGVARFWASFQSLGGVAALGYPSSHRFQMGDGFTYQATQGALLQWRPEFGRAALANTFEMLQAAGKDNWLEQAKGIPRPISDDGSGGDWTRAKSTRLGWLTNDGIRAQYLSAGSEERAIELYGLPMSKPEKRGPFVVQRFQRIAFQQWVESVPGMPAPGSVVRVLGGDLLKEAGLITGAAAEPKPQ
jgi:hypothetical protein